jgi:hypothetical protein
MLRKNLLPLYLLFALQTVVQTASANEEILLTNTAQPAATLLLSQQGGYQLLSWSLDQSRFTQHALLRQEVYRSSTSELADAELLQILPPTEQVMIDETANSWQHYWYWLRLVDSAGQQYWQSGQTEPHHDLSDVRQTEHALNTMVTAAAHPLCKAGATIENQTVDCGGITIGSSCSGDSEKQAPVLTLRNATVKNLRISATGGADGIHCNSGNCTIENVVWEEICEDAATNNGNTLTIIGGSAFNSKNGPGGKPDKVFQQNAKNSTTVIKGNFTLLGENGKLWRSCGDCSNNGGPRYLNINGITINSTLDSLAGVNRNYKDVATIRAVKVKNYKAGKPKICEEYKGVVKGQGKSESYGEQWNTAACNVSKSDVSSF